MIQLIVADDHALFRDGLVNFLAQKEGIRVVATANNGEMLLQQAAEYQVDIVLMDHDMPAVSGMDAVTRLRSLRPEIRIIVLTALADERLLYDYKALDVDGILLKVEEPELILEAIISVSKGAQYVSDHVARLIERAAQSDKLTSRERQVIRHIAEGLTTKEISQVMGVSPKTIDNHRTNLMRKLDLHNAAEVVTYAAKTGLV